MSVKKKLNIIQMIKWNVSGVTKVSKIYLGLYKIKKDRYIFYSGNKCIDIINSI